MIGKTNAVVIVGGESSYGDAVAADLLAGKTALSGGNEITGTMTNRGEVDTDITTKAQVVTIAAGYHNGSGTVQISAAEQAKVIAGNIKSGVTLLGVAGTVRAVPLLASGIALVAMEFDESPITYDWSTQFTAWNGKTIMVVWSTDEEGAASSTYKIFNQTVSANSSGVIIGKVMSSTAILLTGTISNAATTTSIAFAGLTGGDFVQILMNVYEVV